VGFHPADPGSNPGTSIYDNSCASDACTLLMNSRITDNCTVRDDPVNRDLSREKSNCRDEYS
jgi:hypothetical protein